MSLLVVSEILGLSVNALTADGKYYLCNKENSSQPIQMQLSKKDNFFMMSCCIYQIYIKFWIFSKKGWSS